jgi:type I restriction enzyme S subunit
MNYTSTMQTKTNGRALTRSWQWVKLGDICRFVRGVSFLPSESRSTPSTGYLPILRAGNIGDTLDIHNDLLWVTSKNVSAEQRLQVGDIAICMASGSPAVVGKTAQLKESFSGSVGAFCGIIRPKNFTQSDYISYWLRSPDFKTWRDSQARGANIQNLRFSQFIDLQIPFPPEDEQRRIASRLNEQLAAVEAARKAAEEQLQAARKLPSAYLRDVFEGEEAKRWHKQRLAEVGEIVSGITLGRKLNGIETRKVPYLRVANVKDGYLDLADIYEIDATKADIAKCTLKYGDLLLTEGGDPDKLGRGTFWEEQLPECLHQNHIFRVRFDLEKFFPQFLSYQVGSSYGKEYFLAHAKQTTGIATINQKVLGNFPLLIPTLDEQKQIAETLRYKIADAKKLIASLESQLAEINRLPASLLREAFAG